MSATRDTAAPVQSQIALARRLLANGYRTVPILRHDAPAFFERDGRQEPNHPGKRPHGGLWHDKERAVR